MGCCCGKATKETEPESVSVQAKRPNEPEKEEVVVEAAPPEPEPEASPEVEVKPRPKLAPGFYEMPSNNKSSGDKSSKDRSYKDRSDQDNQGESGGKSSREKSSNDEMNHLCVVHLPNNAKSTRLFFDQYDINPSEMTPEEFDAKAKENGFDNLVGQHETNKRLFETECRTKTLNGLKLRYGINYEISNNYFSCGNDIRELIIMGRSRRLVGAAMVDYLQSLEVRPFRKEIISSDLDHIVETKLLNEKLFKCPKEPEPPEENSSCYELLRGDMQAEIKYFQKFCEVGTDTVKPGLYDIQDGLAYYQFLPHDYPLHRTPFKRIAKGFANQNLKFKRLDSLLYKGNPYHVVAIYGDDSKKILACRNHLMTTSKPFKESTNDIYTYPDRVQTTLYLKNLQEQQQPQQDTQNNQYSSLNNNNEVVTGLCHVEPFHRNFLPAHINSLPIDLQRQQKEKCFALGIKIKYGKRFSDIPTCESPTRFCVFFDQNELSIRQSAVDYALKSHLCCATMVGFFKDNTVCYLIFGNKTHPKQCIETLQEIITQFTFHEMDYVPFVKSFLV